MNDEEIKEFLKKATEARKRIREILPSDVEGQKDMGAIVLDVRDPYEREAGHISGSVNVSFKFLAEKITIIAADKSSPINCYCNGGNRGALAADQLQNLGYINVASIAGGFNAFKIWKNKNDI